MNMTIKVGVIVLIAAAGLAITVIDSSADDSELRAKILNTWAPEERTFNERIFPWKSDDSKAALRITYSGKDKSICNARVTGKTEPDSDSWKTQVRYQYSVTAGKRYIYSFKAWTDRGTRVLNFNYFTSTTDIGWHGAVNINSDNTKTYTISGKILPSSEVNQLEFWCADQLGTFHISDIKIEEY